ncbi:MAG: hypothetical protein NTY12_01800 [Candidatus Falkowbacteria bacterium]|nr:hypothetical protein [Candidatus Falkowbacteria bacterium]
MPNKQKKIAEDSDAMIVMIDDIKIEGWILNTKCDCGAFQVYCEKYDAEFCPQENTWLNVGCGDANCEYCKVRPRKPLNL